jgi:hypothetical protein
MALGKQVERSRPAVAPGRQVEKLQPAEAPDMALGMRRSAADNNHRHRPRARQIGTLRQSYTETPIRLRKDSLFCSAYITSIDLYGFSDRGENVSLL